MDFTEFISKIFFHEWKIFMLLFLIIGLYVYYTRTFNHFIKRNVEYMKPTIFVGNLGPRLRAKLSFHEFHNQIYSNFKMSKIGGVFEGRKPVLYICDPYLIKAVTIRDFDHFVNRTMANVNGQYLGKSLLNLQDSHWKGVRSTISPAFSSARLRNMLHLIHNCSEQMVKFLNNHDGEEIEMKDALGHFTLDVIGACAFGIKCDMANSENKQFMKAAEKFGEMSKIKRIFIFLILMFMPKLFRILNVSFLNRESIEELLKILKATKSERRSSGEKRADFLQLLLDAADGDVKMGTTNIKFDDETVDAQSLLFLLAGFETSSTLLAFAIHELAVKPELQAKLRSHIKENVQETNVTYEQLSKLHYLEAFLLETLRMYPPVARIDRICSKNYVLPDTSVQINVGDTVSIPVYGLHMDHDIYPEPKEFRPERFIGEEKAERSSYLFLGFGAGPRNCIGQRFAMFSTKLAMVSLLTNFEFSESIKTQNPIQFDKRSVLLKSEKGIWVQVKKI